MTSQTRLSSSIVALGFVLMLPHAAAAQDLTTQLNGVWKLTSIVLREVGTGATTNTFGEKPVGYAIFTRGGHFTWGWVSDGRKVPAGPVPSDAERVALFNTLGFGSGAYRVEGNTVSLRYDSSWNQSWTGTERKAEMQVSGKTLTWKSPPFKSLDGKDVVAITTLERME
jgi:lipocalin-like protein